MREDVSVGADMKQPLSRYLAPRESIHSNYLVAGRIAYDRVVHQGNEKQWSPEYDVCRRYDQEHFHSLHALALHPPQIIPHLPVLLDRAAPLEYRRLPFPSLPGKPPRPLVRKKFAEKSPAERAEAANGENFPAQESREILASRSRDSVVIFTAYVENSFRVLTIYGYAVVWMEGKFGWIGTKRVR